MCPVYFFVRALPCSVVPCMTIITACKQLLTTPIYLLDECRTLWGEPERVHAGAECASSCMCMSSECDVEHSTT